MHLSHQYNAAYFSGWVKNRCTYHTNTMPLTFLAWYRIDAPITPIQRRLLFWLGTESMHLSHQYNAANFSGLVQNRCTYHTNTTPLTFLAWYKIDEPITPIQRRLLFWLGTESMYLTHQYNVAYFSGLVQNRCTYHTNYWCDRCIDSVPSQKSKRRCIGVLGASILYQARKVSGVVLV
jgi:uncharacterized membrane protein YkvA (DUF1232 family)